MKYKILIVDDEPSIRELLTAFLEMEGEYEAHTASNGEEGLRQLYQHHPDLVVTDIMMPGMDGYEFAHHVRQACDVPIMIITGVTSAGEDGNVRKIAPEIDDYMTKPIGMDDFLSRVAALLRNSARSREVSGIRGQVSDSPAVVER